MLVTSLPAWPTSPPPREKKKLAPRRFWSRYLRATVRAIVDFPVPAKPFSQKIHRSSCPSAQLHISRRRSTRVSGRQVGSYCRWYVLNGASAATGKELSTLFKSKVPCQLSIASVQEIAECNLPSPLLKYTSRAWPAKSCEWWLADKPLMD
jgi:hypothetical protein